MEKGPGDIKGYGGSPKRLNKSPEGYSNPYERSFNADNGVEDDETVSKGLGDADFTVTEPKNIGDDGKG